MDDLALPRKIRTLRHKRKLSLSKVSDLTGYTKSYISMIELGKKSPPINTLRKIAKALSVEMSAFFSTAKTENALIIDRKRRRRSTCGNATQFGHSYQPVASSGLSKRMEAFIAVFPYGYATTESFSHEGEELLYVIEGRIRFNYGKREILLAEGDCIYFDCNMPHHGRAADLRPAKALAVIYTP
jgi:transcriptional regulator with XRE-family HTH domain